MPLITGAGLELVAAAVGGTANGVALGADDDTEAVVLAAVELDRGAGLEPPPLDGAGVEGGGVEGGGVVGGGVVAGVVRL